MATQKQAVVSRSDPGVNFDEYTPSNTTNFPGGMSREIRVQTSGTIAFVFPDGEVKVWPASHVPDGAIISMQAIRINATSTTATGFVVVY